MGWGSEKWAMRSQDWQGKRTAKGLLVALGCTVRKPDLKEQHLRRAEPLFALGVNHSRGPHSAFLLTYLGFCLGSAPQQELPALLLGLA